MAAEVADEAARLLRTQFGVESGRYFTEFVPLPGAPEEPVAELLQRLRTRAANLGVAEAALDGLVARYGSDASEVLDLVEESGRLGACLDDLPYLAAEVAYAVRNEMALSLEDVLRRRLHVFYEAADGGLSVAPAVARIMAAEPGIGWDDVEIRAEVERYAAAVRRTHPDAGRTEAADD